MSADALYVTPDQLCVGLYIHLDRGWMEHSFTFSSFKIKDEAQLLAVRALGLPRLRYDPKRSDVKPLPLPATPPPAAPTPPQPSAEEMAEEGAGEAEEKAAEPAAEAPAEGGEAAAE